MAWFEFLKKKQPTASVAKDRLQIIVARERTATAGEPTGYLPQLQQELLAVIAKYEKVDMDQVTVQLDKKGDAEVLELNIVLPEAQVDRGNVRPRIVYA